MVVSITHGDNAGGGNSRVACRVVDDVYRWFIDSAISVDISTAALRQIELAWQSKSQAWSGHEEAGGILRGIRTGAPEKRVRIHGVDSYCSTGLHHVLSSQRQRPLAPGAGEVVGFYRVDVSGRGFSPRDTAMMHEKFTEPDSIGLIIQTNSTAIMLVSTEQGLGAATVDFPLRFTAPETLLPPGTGMPVLSEGQAGGAFPWKWLAIGLGCVGLICAAWFNLPGRKTKDAVEAPSSNGLGLAATRQGNSVQFVWNRQSTDVLQASEATLSIVDGTLESSTHLTAADLGQGAFWYFPASPSIRGKLEVVRPDGRRISARVVVLVPLANAATSEPVAPAPASPVQASGPVKASPPVKASVPVKAAAPSHRPPAATNPPPVKAAAIPPSRPWLGAVPAPSQAGRRNYELPEAPAIVPSPDHPDHRDLPNLPAPAQSVEVRPAMPATPAPSAPIKSRVAAITPATATVYPRPIVPRELKAMILREVEIQVRLQIDENGRVLDAQESHPEGSVARTLGRIAADTARLWRFEPARQDGHPVATVMTIQFTFGPGK